MIEAKTTCGKTITITREEPNAFYGRLEGTLGLSRWWKDTGHGTGQAAGTIIDRDSFITDEKPVEDVVNHPAHYTTGPWKCGCGKVIEPLWISRHLNFARGNALKYIMRAGLKDPAKEIEDLKKSRFYLDDEIKRLENKV